MDVEAGEHLSVNVRVERRAEGLSACIDAVNKARRVKCVRSYPLSTKSPEDIARSFVLEVSQKYTAFKDLTEFVERQIARAIHAESREPVEPK